MLFVSHMQNAIINSCCTCLYDFVQVNELRCNLDTINGAAREVRPLIFGFVKLALASYTR